MKTVLTISDYWLTFLISVALPMVVALVTRRFSPGGVKAGVLIALSVLTGWLGSLQATGGRFELGAAVTGIAVSFVTAVGFHAGLLKPWRITGDNGAILRSVPGGLVGQPSFSVEDRQ